jgi:hypothetical protein
LAEGIATASEILAAETSTLDEVKRAASTLSDLLREAKKTGEPLPGQMFDMTEFLANPSFELGTTGWTLDKQASGWSDFGTWSDRPAADGNSFVSAICQSITHLDLYQTVQGLPAGSYTMEASLRNTDGTHCLSNQHIYAKAGEVTYNSNSLTTVSGTGNNDWTRLAVADVDLVANGSLRIGACSDGDGSSTKGWFQADDFRLYYWGKKSDPDTEVSKVTSQPVRYHYYDLQGAQLSAPQRGVNIVKEVLNDGSVRMRKLLVD